MKYLNNVKNMDVLKVTEDNIEELILERNNCLPPILSSLDEIEHCVKLLEDVKLCMKYLPTYNISNIDQELLQYVLPPIKKNLLKLYGDNSMLSDTVDDEFVLNILKDNLQIAADFLAIIKVVLEYLSQNSEINLFNLNNTASLVYLISSTFGHCKNSTDSYKQSFNTELIVLFKITQEVHLMFLKFFETHVVMKNEADSTEEIKILIEVLDVICSMGEILSGLNLKSMSDNWKIFTAISQKFSSVLRDEMDLKSPITHLGHEVYRKLSSIENQEEKDASQIIKITGFLIKVTLKICDIFWDCLENISNEILRFCLIVYSFPVDRFRSQGHSSDLLCLTENTIFKTTEPLLVRLLKDPQCHKILSSENLRCDKHAFGLVNFLNGILRASILNQTKTPELEIDGIINAIFTAVAQCFTEFFWDSEPTEGIFDNLVFNISAAVILYDECYVEVEKILLKNLLQEHIFASLLATEVWTLLLRNSDPVVCVTTLSNLLHIYQELNFGIFTHRPEKVFLKCFIQRVFKILPYHFKNEFALKCNPCSYVDCWKVIGFENFPFQHRLSINAISNTTMDRLEALESGNFTSKDISVAEVLNLLSTVKFSKIGVDTTNLARAVHSIWECDLANADISNNNIFKNFFMGLCRITSTLVNEFNSKQIVTILSKLRSISVHNSYKVLICDFLSTLSKKLTDNSHNNSKISTLVADITSQNLLITNSNIIKQEILEVLRNFSINDGHETIKNLRLTKEMQGDISNYLQRNAPPIRFDREYFEFLANLSYRHECVEWRKDPGPKLKKVKVDDRPAPVCKELQLPLVKQVAKPSKWCKITEVAPKEENDENKEEGNVNDVIRNIKGEVKCLVNVLKTEKLTAKNASDIRMIANQILSFL